MIKVWIDPKETAAGDRCGGATGDEVENRATPVTAVFERALEVRPPIQ
jgi:hypothetical protein